MNPTDLIRESKRSKGQVPFIYINTREKKIIPKITLVAEGTFVPVTGREVHSGNIEAVTTKEKSKFPQDFFPECKWSRKGFLRTRWSVRGTVFDLINIHLFHDASNFIAMETVRAAMHYFSHESLFLPIVQVLEMNTTVQLLTASKKFRL